MTIRRNLFTITCGLILLIVGFFGEQLTTLVGVVPTIASTNPRLMLRVLLVSGGMLLIFPELAKPLIVFGSAVKNGLHETIEDIESKIKEVRIRNYLKEQALRNRQALRRLKRELKEAIE
ncbi:MAG: hypothetical protein QXT26_06770 [Thermoproteota archaeon]